MHFFRWVCRERSHSRGRNAYLMEKKISLFAMKVVGEKKTTCSSIVCLLFKKYTIYILQEIVIMDNQ